MTQPNAYPPEYSDDSETIRLAGRSAFAFAAFVVMAIIVIGCGALWQMAMAHYNETGMVIALTIVILAIVKRRK